MEQSSKMIGLKHGPGRERMDIFSSRQGREIPGAAKSNKRIFPKIFGVFLLLLLIGMGGATVYYYNQYQSVLNTPTTSNTSEVQSIVETIGKFIELPENEEPTLATVADVEKIKDQPFFTKAENGDKVLFYTNAAQAILFRPSTGKIVNMTIVNVADTKAGDGTLPGTVSEELSVEGATSLGVASEETPALTVAIYNGSAMSGITDALEAEIEKRFPTLTIQVKGKAAAGKYQETLVMDLSGNNTAAVQALAKTLGGTVVETIPEGEVAPDTDLLVIVGNDR